MSVLDGGRQQLAPVPSSVRVARMRVAQHLTTVDADTLDSIILCTSEVVTNAIEHGSPPIQFAIAHHEGCVRVEVHDASQADPEVQQPGLRSVRGRGLLIVDRLADRWDVEHGADGKLVWFEFDLQ